MVQEEYGISHKIKVLISRDLGQDKLVVGLEDLKDLGILNPKFPRKLPDKRKEYVRPLQGDGHEAGQRSSRPEYHHLLRQQQKRVVHACAFC